jgi:uncharacterized protein (DUF983 family)
MKNEDESRSPNYFVSLLQLKCPHCRRGDMFRQKSSYKKGLLKMHDTCAVCGQKMEIEPSFYYGTGYVSYALSVALTAASFVAWWVIIGMSLKDDRFFWWIGFNAVLLLAAQPYLMRLSRTVWLSFFVSYDKDAGCGQMIQNKIKS